MENISGEISWSRVRLDRFLSSDWWKDKVFMRCLTIWVSNPTNDMTNDTPHCFPGGLSTKSTLEHSMWQIWISHLGHFLVDVFVKFGHKGPWKISQDLLWSFLKYINIWQVQGCLTIFQKMGALRKAKFSWWRSDDYPIIILVLGG